MSSASEVSTTPLIHILPNEILSHIFLLGHRSYSLEDPLAQELLITASAVCQLWRNIAIANSFLWSTTLYSPPPKIAQESLDHEIALISSRIETFLSRSRNASLDFLLTKGLKSVDADQTVISLMRPHFHRCRTIWAEVGYNNVPLMGVLFPLEGEMSRLKELRVKPPTPRRYVGISYPLFGVGNNSRELENLKICGGIPVHLQHLKTSNIRKLDIGFDTTLNPGRSDFRAHRSDPIPVLHQNSLTITDLTLNLDDINLSPNQEIIQLPLLKSFTTTPLSISLVSKLLSCPNIEELALIRGFSDLSSIDKPETHHLGWSTLRRVTIHHYFEHIDFQNLLVAIPDVKEIDVRGTTIFGTIRASSLLFLSALNPPARLVRQLEYLRIYPAVVQYDKAEGKRRDAKHVLINQLLLDLWDTRPELKVELSRGLKWMKDEAFDELLLSKPGLFSEIETPCIA